MVVAALPEEENRRPWHELHCPQGTLSRLYALYVVGLLLQLVTEKDQSRAVCVILYMITSQKTLPPSGEITLKEEKGGGRKVVRYQRELL